MLKEVEDRMEIMRLVGKWFWAVALAVTFINAGIFRYRSRRHIAERPELASGYRTLVLGFTFWGSIPWIVMGLGCTIGGVPTVWHFFRPRDGNPWVLAWFGCVFAVWLLGTYWLVVRGGAEMLASHPGLLNVKRISPTTIKLWWALCLLGGVAGVAIMFVTDIPLPAW